MGNYFDYITGGRDEIRRRFGERIRYLCNGSGEIDAAKLERYSELPEGVIAGILEGNDKLVNFSVIEAVADACDLQIDDGFGEVRLTKEEVRELNQMAADERFVALAGPQLDEDRRARLFLLTRALEEL